MRDPALDRLLFALADLWRAEPRPEAEATAQALTATQIATPLRSGLPGPHDAAIRALLAGKGPLAEATLALFDRLPWGTNPVDAQVGPYAAIFAVAELLGPDGPIPAPDLRMGFFYQAPGTYYPLHNHDADETYVILAGSAVWTAGDDTRLRGAGEVIHHPSRLPHAFAAGPEGLLAVWRWSGDINTHSYGFTEDPALGVA